jgi:hypothetical protein
MQNVLPFVLVMRLYKLMQQLVLVQHSTIMPSTCTVHSTCNCIDLEGEAAPQALVAQPS